MALLRLDFPITKQPTKSMPEKEKTPGARAPLKLVLGARQTTEFSEPKKTAGKARVSLWPDADILEQVKHFCHVRNITYSQFFESAAVQFMENTGEKTLAFGARYSPQIDDLDLNPDLDETIINLSKFWIDAWNRHENKRGPIPKFRWSNKDAAAAADFRDIDARILELGMVQTIGQKQPGSGKIISFRYFIPEICKWISAAESMSPNAIQIAHDRNTATLRRHLNLPKQEKTNVS